MKKVLSLILALAMVLALAACGDSGDAGKPSNNSPSPTPPQSSAPVNTPNSPEPSAPATPSPAPSAPATPSPEPSAPATPSPEPSPEPSPVTPEPSAPATPSPEPSPEPSQAAPEPSAPATPSPEPSAPATPSPEPSQPATPSPEPSPVTPDPGPETSQPASQPPAQTVTPASTTINFGSQTTALEGTWKLAQVKTASGSYGAVSADAITLKVTLEEDPYELVDGEAYIHNRVWNLTAFLSFGLADVKAELDADDIESYKGSATWEAFTKGKVMADGEWYEQPGPAVVRFKDIDDYGLYLDKVAGVPDSIETTERNMIIAMNSSGQLLLGYSKSHIENEGTAGDWVYCLVFEK